MKGQSVVFSHGKDDWQTPPKLFEGLHEEFQFTMDGAANNHNHLLPRWFGPGGVAKDALSQIGLNHERIFCNPPYSQVAQFVEWAAISEALTVLLIPARTDTRWWHEYIWDRIDRAFRPDVEVRFIRGRVKFLDGTGIDWYIPTKGKRKGLRTKKPGAPFPSAIVVFRKA